MKYIVLRKFNPNHDAKGKFSSGDGGSSQPDLEPTQMSALKSYTVNGYEEINRVLRGTVLPNPQDRPPLVQHLDAVLVAEAKQKIHELDGAMRTHSLPEMTTYRKLSVEALPDDVMSRATGDPAILNGATFVDKGYVSTSKSEMVAMGLGSDDFEAVMRIPSGTHGIDVDKVGGAGNPSLHEEEILLDRGLTYRIDDARKITTVGGSTRIQFHISVVSNV